jgi:hypothetical protein
MHYSTWYSTSFIMVNSADKRRIPPNNNEQSQFVHSQVPTHVSSNSYPTWDVHVKTCPAMHLIRRARYEYRLLYSVLVAAARFTLLKYRKEIVLTCKQVDFISQRHTGQDCFFLNSI